MLKRNYFFIKAQDLKRDANNFTNKKILCAHYLPILLQAWY